MNESHIYSYYTDLHDSTTILTRVLLRTYLSPRMAIVYILSCLLYDVIGGANCRGDSNAGHGRGLFPFTPMIMALYYVRIILQKPT